MRIPRSTSQESNGDGIAPPSRCSLRMRSERLVGDARHDRAAHDVAMAAEVLRGGMDDEIGAELERVLQHRRREGVVHGDARAARVRQPRSRARCR